MIDYSVVKDGLNKAILVNLSDHISEAELSFLSNELVKGPESPLYSAKLIIDITNMVNCNAVGVKKVLLSLRDKVSEVLFVSDRAVERGLFIFMCGIINMKCDVVNKLPFRSLAAASESE